MTGGNTESAIRWLARRMNSESFGKQSDRQLVEQVLDERNEAVFEVLVRRHGQMVYRVCWRVLQQSEDAEDAFQATFLVLAQKLGTLRDRDCLASWLHGVAHRTALKARSLATIRRRHETLVPVPSTVPADDLTWKELRSVLDAELVRLPEKWRRPLILCYLEGRTQDEAAAQLGWSGNTLRRRLEEARTALGRTLGRKGFGPTVLAAVLLSDCTSSGIALPTATPALIDAAVLLATRRAAGVLISPNVALLTDGVLKAMPLKNHKIAMVLLVIGAIGTIGSAMRLHSGGEQPLTEIRAEPQVEKPKGAPPKASAGPTQPKTDAEKIQGLWEVTERREDGMSLLFPNEATNGSLFIEGDEFFLSYMSKGTPMGGSIWKANFTLNSEATPKSIDLTSGGAKKPDTFGIYKLDGDDLLICLPREHPFARRPTEFTAEKGTKQELVKLKRNAEKAATLTSNTTPEKPTNEMIRIRLQQAEKNLRTAEYYEQTGHPGTAIFYYELVEEQTRKTLDDLQVRTALLKEQLKKAQEEALKVPAKVKTDTEKLQGNWVVTEIRQDGETRQVRDDVKDLKPQSYFERLFAGTVKFEGNEFRLLLPDGKATSGIASFKLNTAKSPRNIDLTLSQGPESHELWLGIYRVDGDELILCLPKAEPFDQRPKYFTADKGSNQEIIKLKRSNPVR
jgi:RNA polymerase sigma factor (sigma-70 family)